MVGTVAFFRRFAPAILLRPMFSSSSFLISDRIALITWISLCSLSMVLTYFRPVCISHNGIQPTVRPHLTCKHAISIYRCKLVTPVYTDVLFHSEFISKPNIWPTEKWGATQEQQSVSRPLTVSSHDGESVIFFLVIWCLPLSLLLLNIHLLCQRKATIGPWERDGLGSSSLYQGDRVNCFSFKLLLTVAEMHKDGQDIIYICLTSICFVSKPSVSSFCPKFV